MKILVTGDRNWTSTDTILNAITAHMPCTVIQGGASGADRIAERICVKLSIKCIGYPANWTIYGRAAGPIRNRQMLDSEQPDLVLAFHNDLSKSKGTRDMCKQARKRNITVKLYSDDGQHEVLS